MRETDRPDRTDSTGAGDLLGGNDDLRVLPHGVVRLSDPNVRATARARPPAVAWPIAHRGRVTLLRGPEKDGKSALLRAAVAAVTGGRRFLEQATIGGSVLWVGQEAAADLCICTSSAPTQGLRHGTWPTAFGAGAGGTISCETRLSGWPPRGSSISPRGRAPAPAAAGAARSPKEAVAGPSASKRRIPEPRRTERRRRRVRRSRSFPRLRFHRWLETETQRFPPETGRGGLFGERFRGCVSRDGRKRKRDDGCGTGVGGVFGGRDRFRRCRARRRRGGWGWPAGVRGATEPYATGSRSPAALVSAEWRQRDPTDVHDRTHAFPTQRPVDRGVSEAFDQLVDHGFLRQAPSKHYPEPRYALTQSGYQRVGPLMFVFPSVVWLRRPSVPVLRLDSRWLPRISRRRAIGSRTRAVFGNASNGSSPARAGHSFQVPATTPVLGFIPAWSVLTGGLLLVAVDDLVRLLDAAHDAVASRSLQHPSWALGTASALDGNAQVEPVGGRAAPNPLGAVAAAALALGFQHLYRLELDPAFPLAPFGHGCAPAARRR